MAPQPHPTSVDHFFAKNQYPILMSAFATQVCHWQYIKKTSPSPAVDYPFASVSNTRTAAFPRPLRAGLGWALVAIALLTKITFAKKNLRDSRDPVVLQGLKKKGLMGEGRKEL